MLRMILLLFVAGAASAQFSNVFRFGDDSPEDLFDDSPEDFFRSRNRNGNRNFFSDSRSDENFAVISNSNARNSGNRNTNRNILFVDSIEDLFGNSRRSGVRNRNFFGSIEDDSREGFFRINGINSNRNFNSFNRNTNQNTNRNRNTVTPKPRTFNTNRNRNTVTPRPRTFNTNTNRNRNRNTVTPKPRTFNTNRNAFTPRPTASKVPSFFSINRHINTNNNRIKNRSFNVNNSNRRFRDSDEDSRENSIFLRNNRNRNTFNNRNQNTFNRNRNTFRSTNNRNRNSFRSTNSNRFNNGFRRTSFESKESVESIFDDLFDDDRSDRLRARSAFSRLANSRTNSDFAHSFVTSLGGPNSKPVASAASKRTNSIPNHFSAARHSGTKTAKLSKPSKPQLKKVTKHNSITSQLNAIRNPKIGETRQVAAFGFPTRSSKKNQRSNILSPNAIRNIASNLVSRTQSSLSSSPTKSGLPLNTSTKSKNPKSSSTKTGLPLNALTKSKNTKSSGSKSHFNSKLSNWLSSGGNGYYVSMSTGNSSPVTYFVNMDDDKK